MLFRSSVTTFAVMNENGKKRIGVLFDLDGVLLDTEDIYTRFWEAVDRRYPTGVPDFAHVIKGSNLQEILHNHFPVESRQQVTDMLNEFQRDMRYCFFAGAMEFVDQLNSAGIPAVVVTSSDQAKMNAVYSQHPDFKRHFAHVVTGDMVQNAKPDPECFLLGAKLIGCPIADCYVFEDSVNGLQAAQASGATVIGLATTNSRSAIQCYSHCVIDHLEGFSVDDMLNVTPPAR